MEDQELLKQIAMLKDGFGYQKDQADTYAKVLREIWDSLDKLIDRISYDEEGVVDPLNDIKNSIPETALRRGG